MLTFDAINKRVILDTASVTATALYSRSCDWLALADNAKYGAVFRQVGGDDLGAGLSIPPYFFLQGAWRVRPMEASHNLTITGNLFVEGGGVPVVQTLGTYQVNVNYTVPVQAQGISTSGATGPTAAEIVSGLMAALNSTTGQRTLGQHLQIQTAVLAGSTLGAGTGHIEFIDGAVSVEADVPLPGQVGERSNVVVVGV